MPEDTNRKIKAKSHYLNIASDGQFGTQWAYHLGIGEMLNDVLNDPSFFAPVRDNMKPCDTIRVFETKDGCVTSYAELLVVKKCKDRVFTEMVHCYRADAKPGEPDAQEDTEDSDPEVYVDGNASASWNNRKKAYEVIKDDGTVVARVKDKEMAGRIARGDAPLLPEYKPED